MVISAVNGSSTNNVGHLFFSHSRVFAKKNVCGSCNGVCIKPTTWHVYFIVHEAVGELVVFQSITFFCVILVKEISCVCGKITVYSPKNRQMSKIDWRNHIHKAHFLTQERKSRRKFSPTTSLALKKLTPHKDVFIFKEEVRKRYFYKERRSSRMTLFTENISIWNRKPSSHKEHLHLRRRSLWKLFS